jgi:rhodanese-related sulfurtransferase
MLKPLPELIAAARANLRCLDAESAMQEIVGNNGTIIDVREPVEVSAQPAPHSINIPRGILEMKVMDIIPDADQPLYVHCATGGRATLAAEQLLRLGYRQVSVITCPIDVVSAQQALLGAASDS